MRHTKPLSRTQSAPLPIMHPAAASMLLAPQQTILENQELVKQYQDQLAKEQQKKSVIGVRLSLQCFVLIRDYYSSPCASNILSGHCHGDV